MRHEWSTCVFDENSAATTGTPHRTRSTAQARFDLVAAEDPTATHLTTDARSPEQIADDVLTELASHRQAVA